ncbi:MAG: CoB--CoM heterodisulfide reductase iron-sulfur subunit B family protein [Candidatus Thorarchaeota archaeon]
MSRNTKTKEFAFFPGCSIPSGFAKYEKLVLDVLELFDISVTYPQGMTCCPAPMSFEVLGDDDDYYAVGARNIALCEELELDMLSPCPGCTMTFSRVNKKLRSDERLREYVNTSLKKIGRHYQGTINIKSLLRVLYEDIGLDSIRARISKPLRNLKVAIHYGCHAFEELDEYNDPNNPSVLELLAEALGMEVVKYSSANECCLVFANPVDRDFVLKSIRKKLKDISEAGADCILVICASCFSQFDKTQEMMSWIDMIDESDQIPVYLYPELLAFAIGTDLDEIGLEEHKVDAKTLLLERDSSQEC